MNHKNNSGYTMKWRKGRELQSVTDSAGQVVSFSYNANGIRTAKNDCGVVHSYLVDGTKILRESYSDKTLDYLYDNEDSVCGLILNGTAYYFYKNLQGDVIAITNADGVVKARYSYDAWGACTVESDTSGTNIASINPFRYRSYYFDVETGFYYLNSRYYDPIVGRFINADDTFDGTVLGFNLFAYCHNNSVMLMDNSGYSPIQAVFATIGAIAGWFLGDYIARRLGYYPDRGGFWNKAKYWTIRAGMIVGGAVIGWFAASALTAILKGFIFSSPKLIASTPIWVYQFLGIGVGSGSVVLGKYPLYVQLAERLGSQIFQIATDIWNSMTTTAQWAANRAFLDKIIASGQKITLQTQASKATGYFLKEIEYLLQHGYKIIENGWAMKKR